MKLKTLFWAGVCLVLLPRGACANTVFTFQGQVDLDKKQFNVVFRVPPSENRQPSAEASPQDSSGTTKKYAVKLSGEQTSESDYRLLLDVEHLKTPLWDLLSKIESSIQIVREDAVSKDGVAVNPRRSLRGEIRSQYSMVDYKPIRELSGKFQIKDNQLVLDSLAFGNLACRGTIALIYPYALDVKVNLKNVDLEDFLNFWVQGNTYDSAGSVSGEIDVSGDVEHLALKGNLESHNGYIDKLDFNSIYLNAEGVYPHLQVANSTISGTDGVSFILDGPFDLSDQENFKRQINALTFSPLVSDSISEREWTIKRLKQEGPTSTEVKYLLRKSEGPGSPRTEESGMLGIEQIMEF